MNVVKIQYKDDRDWKTWVDSTVTNWDNYSTKLKEERVQPAWVAPEVTSDTWDGKDSDVQHIRWDSYYFQIFIKESELHDINKIKSCKDIVITYYTKNSAGTIINNTYTLDLTKSDFLEIEDPERADTTTGWTVNITFRTNRTVINKALPVLNTNKITFEQTPGWSLFEAAELNSSFGKVAALSDSSVAFFDGSDLYKYNIVNGEYVQEGAALPISFASIYDITSLDADSIAILHDGLGLLSKYEFSNGVWALVGNLLNLAGSFLNPVLCSLTNSRVVVYDELISQLRAYDFDGTDWSQVGSSFTLSSSSTTYDICKMTSSSIAIVIQSGNYLRSYDFNGSVFSLDQSFTINSMVNPSISRLSDSRVVLIDGGNDALRSYSLSGTWSLESGSLSLAGTFPICEALDEDNVIVHNAVIDGFYTYGTVNYYTDYDVLDYNRQTESLFIDWPDGTRKLARTIDKAGYESVMYIESDKYDNFISWLKSSQTIYINDVEVDEVEFEPSIIAEGLWKIVVSGITETIQDDKDLSPNNTYNISMSGGGLVFYSDYPILQNIRDVQKVDVEWDDGNTVTLQTVTKPTNIFTYFTSDPATIIEQVNIYNDVVLGGNTITEIETSQEEVLLNLFKVTINGVHDVANDLLYVFPTSGNHLEIIDENPTTYDFYTDYDVMLVSEDPIINATENQTGINTPTKGITKEVKQAKFFLSEANAFSLKSKFELYKPGWSLKLNTVAVKEARPVSPNRIGVDLYEVDVICLMDTTDN